MLSRNRGDTIIEVLLSITVFSLLSVGAMTIMNQGTNSAQRALEITLVREQIDAQAESLRAAHQAYTALTNSADRSSSQWSQITALPESGNATEPTTGGCPEPSNSAFIMNPKNATLHRGGTAWFTNMNNSTSPYAQFDTDPSSRAPAHGIWIERRLVENDDDTSVVNAQEFTVRTCWFGAGMNDTPLTIDTVVRLYDPSA